MKAGFLFIPMIYNSKITHFSVDFKFNIISFDMIFKEFGIG